MSVDGRLHQVPCPPCVTERTVSGYGAQRVADGGRHIDTDFITRLLDLSQEGLYKLLLRKIAELQRATHPRGQTRVH